MIKLLLQNVYFGSKPKDLFEWLLDRIDFPCRSALDRLQPKETEYAFMAVALAMAERKSWPGNRWVKIYVVLFKKELSGCR